MSKGLTGESQLTDPTPQAVPTPAAMPAPAPVSALAPASASAWLTAHRGRMTDDPLVFAIKDRVSLVLIALTIVIAWFAV